MVPEVGQTICGRVRLEELADERLGATAFGRLLTAKLTDTHARLWLTVVDRKLMPSQKDLSRFMAGANALPLMRHQTLVPVGLVDREADFAVVGYEALDGVQSVTELVQTGGAAKLVARCAVEVARGLAFLHRRERVHGALAPGNVLLRAGVPVLIQYGIAELCDPKRLAQAASKIGGDALAPELRDGAKTDPRADVFAWGALLTSLATGAEGGEALMLAREQGFSPAGSRDLGRLLRDAVAEQPEARPENAVELLERLQVADLDEAPGGSAAQNLARRYLAEVAQSADLPGASPASSRPDEATPAGGANLSSLVQEERARQEERQAQRRAFEENQAKWGKAPAPIPVKTEPSRPPPPPPPARPRTGGERAPSRPHPTVDRARPRPEPPPGPAGREDDLDLLLTPDEPAPPQRKQGKKKGKGKKKKPPAPAVAASPPAGVPDDDRIELDVSALPAGRVSGSAGAMTPSRASSQSSGQPISDLTRRAGAHGPRGPAMAALLAVACTLLALGLTVPVASAQGGLASVLGLRDAKTESSAEQADGDGDVQPANGKNGGDGGRDQGEGQGKAQDQAQDQARDQARDGGDADGKKEGEAEGAAKGDRDEDGSTAQADVPTKCPKDMVLVGKVEGAKVCIDRGEHPGLRHRPTTLVSFEAAQAACAEDDKRLCTVTEWRRGCSGGDGRPFPYGRDHEQDRCNEATASGGAQNLSRSGARDTCVSPVGAFDMVGNVAEWAQGPTVVGGDSSTVVPTCHWSQKLPAKTATASLGFRCCLTLRGASPEP